MDVHPLGDETRTEGKRDRNKVQTTTLTERGLLPSRNARFVAVLGLAGALTRAQVLAVQRLNALQNTKATATSAE